MENGIEISENIKITSDKQHNKELRRLNKLSISKVRKLLDYAEKENKHLLCIIVIETKKDITIKNIKGFSTREVSFSTFTSEQLVPLIPVLNTKFTNFIKILTNGIFKK